MSTVDVYRGLWRRRFLILGLTVVTAGVAWYATSIQPKIYEATALVRVQQQIATAGDAFGSLEAGTRLAQTYAAIVTTDSIKRRVASSLGPSVLPQNIRISANPVGNVELLRISARSESPEEAPRVANAASRALQEFIRDTGTLRDQVIVVDMATDPITHVSPRVKLIVALAVLLGLMLNSALALLIESLADPLPEHAEMETVFGYPVLATIPRLSFPGDGMMSPPGSTQLGSKSVRTSAVVSRRVRESGR